jgi:hypothetical protein
MTMSVRNRRWSASTPQGRLRTWGAKVNGVVKTTDVKAKSRKQQDEKPKIQVFDIMRSGSYVIRGAMRDMTKAAYKGDMESFEKQWCDFTRFQAIYKRMEEGKESHGYLGMFG